MRVELLCLDVDGTLTDGKLFYGLSSLNSSLGMQFRTCEKFWESTDSGLVLSQNFSQIQKPHCKYFDFDLQSKSPANQTQNAESALDSANFLDSALPKQDANSSIFDEKSGLCSHERGNRTNEFIDEASGKLPDLSQKDAEFAEIVKVFNAKDGLALAYWTKSLNRKVAIITGKKSEILRHRARELGIEFLFMGVSDKGKIVRDLKKDLGLDSTQIAAIGDDLNDISMFAESSLNFAPRDCAQHLKTLPNIEILRCKGGRGAVREAIEIILQKEGIYEDFISVFAR